jgi:hypothetical protein
MVRRRSEAVTHGDADPALGQFGPLGAAIRCGPVLGEDMMGVVLVAVLAADDSCASVPGH